MYNPSSLAQALETAPAAKQAMLDSLRGPDAAHRITDDQIRAIITSPSFKSRHGRYHPETAYVGDDVNTHGSSSIHMTVAQSQLASHASRRFTLARWVMATFRGAGFLLATASMSPVAH